MFKKATYKNPQDYLQEVNQDMVLNVNTVHDEVNLGVDKFQLRPLLKKIVSLGTAKSIFDKFGMPYMNFLYDVEFSYTGEFTGEGYEGVENFSVYETPLHSEEHLARKKFDKAIESLKGEKQNIEHITIDIGLFEKRQLGTKIKDYHIKDKDFKTAISLTVTTGGKKYKYDNLLNTSIKKLLQPLKTHR